MFKCLLQEISHVGDLRGIVVRVQARDHWLTQRLPAMVGHLRHLLPGHRLRKEGRPEAKDWKDKIKEDDPIRGNCPTRSADSKNVPCEARLAQ